MTNIPMNSNSFSIKLSYGGVDDDGDDEDDDDDDYNKIQDFDE